MTAAPIPLSSGHRAFPGWWRDLAPLHPQQLWISRLLVRRVEALVAIAASTHLDPLRLAVLRGLDAGVLEHAHLEPQLLAGLLQSLARAGLITRKAGDWELTVAGREARTAGLYPVRRQERRTFYFLDLPSTQRAANYLNLRPVLHIPSTASESKPFDPAWLHACIQQPAEWKRRHGFPEEVTDILELRPAEGAADWHRVILDLVEQLLVLFVLVPSTDGKPALLGFQIEEQGWKLHQEAPVLALTETWEEILPDFAVAPSLDDWQHAWRAWCLQRNLTEAEVQACRLERREHRLIVLAPKSFVERLQAIRSDALKHETWLLAGSIWMQCAAQVEIVEA